eukprot:CAMPEP_0201546750 /NCGR_PEP_ID=MMETSP0173_2-20130828/3101_1 /ASSEMBLY_ACC=CAM_ASM_000268 /TAXON_ID=218659 /ORGANISM="Vexillifera sp., Strain DIVA3 564/2" /LENGTH=213 /DNA_ID=CAMNT_0047955521 /DNA_START=1 /DNA_END=639 /DNA_ORIENTATION=+
MRTTSMPTGTGSSSHPKSKVSWPISFVDVQSKRAKFSKLDTKQQRIVQQKNAVLERDFRTVCRLMQQIMPSAKLEGAYQYLKSHISTMSAKFVGTGRTASLLKNQMYEKKGGGIEIDTFEPNPKRLVFDENNEVRTVHSAYYLVAILTPKAGDVARKELEYRARTICKCDDIIYLQKNKAWVLFDRVSDYTRYRRAGQYLREAVVVDDSGKST